MTGARRPRGMFVGLATVDVVYRVPGPPRANEKVTAADRLLLAGGPATNAAIAFGGLGGDALLVTALGRHPLAGTVADELTGCGVAYSDVTPDHPDPPPISSVLVSVGTGDRAVVSDNEGRRAVARTDAVEQVRGMDVLLVDGHHATLARAAVRAAWRHQVPVVVDAGSWRPVFADLIPHAAFVLCSADLRVPGVPAGQTLDALLARGAHAAGVSDGGRPLRWAAAGASGEVPVPEVDVVDTLGAGDVLHGASAFAAARRGVSADALRAWLPWAVSVASLSTTMPGTRAWLPAVGTLPPLP